MAYFLISYDLRKEPDSSGYKKIFDVIQTHDDWAHVLKSVWIVRGHSSKSVYDKIAPAFDLNDGLIVTELAGALCFDKPSDGTSDWLSDRFTCR